MNNPLKKEQKYVHSLLEFSSIQIASKQLFDIKGYNSTLKYCVSFLKNTG